MNIEHLALPLNVECLECLQSLAKTHVHTFAPGQRFSSTARVLLILKNGHYFVLQ